MLNHDQIRWRRLRQLATIALFAIVPTTAKAEVLYHYTDFGYATPIGINAGGDVVLEEGYQGVYHSYGANAGKVSGPTDYGLNAKDVIRGITDSGGITGRQFNRDQITSFFAENNQITEFKNASWYGTEVSGSGQILVRYDADFIGHSTRSTLPRAAVVSQGLRTEVGTYGSSPQGLTEAAAINNAGQVTGYASLVQGDDLGSAHTYASAFLYKDGQLKSLGTLGGWRSAGKGINNLGHVVGDSQLANGSTHAFLAKDGQMIDLGTLTGHRTSSAFGINDSGQIVGISVGDSFKHRAVLWDSGTIKDLNDLVAAETGRTLEWTTGINNAGQIIGTATDAFGGRRGFLLTPIGMAAPAAVPPAVPEPGTWATFGALALGLAAHNRGRARRA